jgi:predicted dienelactone hydrolase
LAPAGAVAATFPVGHTVKRITVPGTLPQETRNVDVHLWYPADATGFAQTAQTVYRSALHGDTRIPAGWKPLSWTLDARLAREAAIAPQGKPFPVIVFSTGNQNDPIDYAYTLEQIAAGGFVVAAPYHANNTADDVRIDFINQQAGTRLINCNDGLAPRATFGPGDCSKTNVPNSIADRVRDVSYVLDAMPGWLPNRVDVAQAGVFGHSRGTLTALTAAGGSTVWGVAPEPRVQAIMGVSIGVQALAQQVSLANVKAPALLAAGSRDATSPPAVSKYAYDNISSADKRYVEIENAHHRTFDSTYCDQAQRSGAIVTADPTRRLDKHTFDLMATHPTSGRTQDYCPYSTFTSPTDITGLLFAANGFTVTPTNVPTTGLSVDPVTQQVADLAVEFFAAKLARAASGGVSGMVPATLSLTLGPTASFGAFTPGVDRTYDASAAANVISTAGDAMLSVADPTGTGRLVNGAFSLAEPVQVRANNGAFAAVSGAPASLLTYTGPISNDAVTLGFRQHIGPNEPLRTGSYSKTLTFTLSTTAP